MRNMFYGNDVLTLVDVQNVFYGAKNFRGGASIDYAKLLGLVRTEATKYIVASSVAKYGGLPELCTPMFDDIYGYVVLSPKYDGLNFFSLLRKFGYKLRYRQFPDGLDPDAHWKGSVGSMMQMDYVDWCPQYQHVVVVSGSGVLAPAFRAGKHNWPNVTRILCAWENTLHSAYEDQEDLVDNIIYLDESVLRD